MTAEGETNSKGGKNGAVIVAASTSGVIAFLLLVTTAPNYKIIIQSDFVKDRQSGSGLGNRQNYTLHLQWHQKTGFSFIVSSQE